MKKYEYKIVSTPTPVAISVKKYDEIAGKIEKELNQLGGDGWEFIQWKDDFQERNDMTFPQTTRK